MACGGADTFSRLWGLDLPKADQRRISGDCWCPSCCPTNRVKAHGTIYWKDLSPVTEMAAVERWLESAVDCVLSSGIIKETTNEWMTTRGYCNKPCIGHATDAADQAGLHVRSLALCTSSLGPLWWLVTPKIMQSWCKRCEASFWTVDDITSVRCVIYGMANDSAPSLPSLEMLMLTV